MQLMLYEKREIISYSLQNCIFFFLVDSQALKFHLKDGYFINGIEKLKEEKIINRQEYNSKNKIKHFIANVKRLII
jgi:hypothetical protein